MSAKQDKNVLGARKSALPDFLGPEEIALRVQTIIAEKNSDKFEMLAGKSRKQLSRYGADSTIPASVLYAAQEIANVSSDWLMRGVIHSHIDHYWHGCYLRIRQHHFGELLDSLAKSGVIQTVHEYHQLVPDRANTYEIFARNEDFLHWYEAQDFLSDASYEEKELANTVAYLEQISAAVTHSVPLLATRLSAGAGLTAEENVVGNMPLPSEVMRALRRDNTKGLVMMQAAGDSMYPTISDGSHVLIDTNARNLVEGIFAFRLENDLKVKRLRTVGLGDIEVISDNPIYPPDRIVGSERQHFDIIGRAIWSGTLL